MKPEPGESDAGCTESPRELGNVTLITVDGRSQDFFVAMAIKALLYSCRSLRFAAVKLLTPVAPRVLPSFITHQSIAPLGGSAYSRFMIKDLHHYVDTEYCLVVQADGFVSSPERWRPEFLNYDYIGAPWPRTTASRHGADITIYNLSEQNPVGNGGFSLRSRRLLQATAGLAFDQLAQFPEDFIICRLCQPYLASQGLKFAPLEVARAFAVELPLPGSSVTPRDTFGFHGRHHHPERALMTIPAYTMEADHGRDAHI